MDRQYTFYSWEVSYFGGKLRSYLRQKGIPHTEIRPTIWGYYVTLPRHTGVAAIPVLVTPDGDWLQDTSDIIDAMERQFPRVPIVPATPVQAIASYLVEMWADEFWLPVGLHTRWCHREENYAFLERDVADNMLPGWPYWLQKRAVAVVAKHMVGYLTATGVVPEQYALLHRWTVQQLDWLDEHFAGVPYVLGSRPSLADVALMGPLYGHLGRDPWPALHLIADRPHVKAWIARMSQAPATSGNWLADDQLPTTLLPLFKGMLRELLPCIDGHLSEITAYRSAHPDAGTIPRFLGDIEFPMLDGRYRRKAMPYILWMLQRLLTAVRAMPSADVVRIRAWLRAADAERLLDVELPPLARDGLSVALGDR